MTRIVNVVPNKYGLFFLNATESDEVIKITKTYLDQLNTILEAFDKARTEAVQGASPPFTDFQQGKINPIKETFAKKLGAVVDSAIILRDQQETAIQNMVKNKFFIDSGTQTAINEMRMIEVRTVLRSMGASEINKAVNGANLFVATAILRSPVPMLSEELLRRAVELRLGTEALQYRDDMTDVVETIASWITRAYQYIGVTPDNRIQFLTLNQSLTV